MKKKGVKGGIILIKIKKKNDDDKSDKSSKDIKMRFLFEDITKEKHEIVKEFNYEEKINELLKEKN